MIKASMKKKALLISSASSAIPMLQFLKTLNYHVSVCGKNKNDPCHAQADQSFFIDYSQKRALLRLCQREDFDYLVPGCSDVSYNSASYAASKLGKYHGFDDFSITRQLHTKNGFKDVCLRNNLRVPRALEYTPSLDLRRIDIPFPLLIKPDDSTFGRGIVKVFNHSQLPGAIQTAREESTNGKVLIQQFVAGQHYHHSAFIQDGKILTGFFSKLFYNTHPYQMDSSYIEHNMPAKIQNIVRQDTDKLVSSLALTDGLLNLQFVTDGKRVYYLEVMRRCLGNLFGTMVEKATNVNYYGLYCRPFLNIKNKSSDAKVTVRHVARQVLLVLEKTPFMSFSHTIPSRKIDIYPLKESGQEIHPAPDDRLAIIFSEFGSKRELVRHVGHINKFVTIHER